MSKMFYSAADAGKELGISGRQLHKVAKQLDIEPMAINGKFFFKSDQVEQMKKRPLPTGRKP